MNDWYKTLQRPPLTPPSWVFGPVWTVLYCMIGAAIILWWRAPERKPNATTNAILAVHVLSNALWTPLFFGMRSPGKALIDIFILVATLVYLIVQFWRAHRLASVLLWPYLLWVSFATYLNIGFFYLNR